MPVLPLPDYTPEFPITKSVKPRQRSAQLPSWGIEQRATSGLNQTAPEWNPRWVLSTADADILDAFLEARASSGNEWIQWTDPDGNPGLFRCDDWTKQLIACEISEVQATFRRVFDISTPLRLSHLWTGAGSTASFNSRLGYRFTVGAADITCQTLGVYLPTSGLAERVTIHRVSTGASIVTADITSTANQWVNVSVAPVVLSAGVQYVISSRSTTGASRSVYRNPTGLSFDLAIGSISYWLGTSDSQPTTSTANVYVFARFGFT